MQRWLLLVSLVAVTALAVAFWIGSRAPTDALVPDARGPAAAPAREAVELVPASASSARSEAAAPVAAEPTPPAEVEVRALEIALPTEIDLVFHGRVIDRETQLPVPNARVGRGAGWAQIAPETEQHTDGDGRFHVTGRSWRKVVLGVLAPGYELAAFGVVGGHTTPETAFEIVLSAVASVRLTVLDAAGAPMPGLRATYSTARHHFGRGDGMALIHAGWIGDATFSAVTDASGVALVADLPPNMTLAGVLHQKRAEVFRAPESITLAPGELRAVEWRVGSGCTIHGVALETDSRPAGGLSVCLEPARVLDAHYFEPSSIEPRRFETTDSEGRFSFADVGPGRWRVGPAPKKLERTKTIAPEDAAACARVVVVPPATARVDVEIRVHRGLSIEGRVLDPTGVPAKHSAITYTRPSERVTGGEDMNDPDGRFVLGPLEEGEYELVAESFGNSVASVPVTARAGDRDVVLRLRQGGVLRGLVVDKASGAPTDAQAVVRSFEPDGGRIILPRANAQGVFELGGLVPGRYDVAASASNGGFGLLRSIEVTAGETRDVRVELEPGARVRIRYAGPWPNVGASVMVGDAIVATDGVKKGMELVLAAPAGDVVVRVRNWVENVEFDLPLKLKASETREVVFDGAWQ